MEFFTEKELQLQIGQPKQCWPIALLKELIDNALDACEKATIAPEITVRLTDESLSVQDNGPGLPGATLRKALDYSVRVSDNAYYVSPTRGQLGNALKCCFAAPLVVDGTRGEVTITTGGTVHHIAITLDLIGQRPVIDHQTTQDLCVQNGTTVTLHWKDL